MAKLEGVSLKGDFDPIFGDRARSVLYLVLEGRPATQPNPRGEVEQYVAGLLDELASCLGSTWRGMLGAGTAAVVDIRHTGERILDSPDGSRYLLKPSGAICYIPPKLDGLAAKLMRSIDALDEQHRQNAALLSAIKVYFGAAPDRPPLGPYDESRCDEPGEVPADAPAIVPREPAR
jgi:hypothetical protein